MKQTSTHLAPGLHRFLRVSIGICYFWFGMLKFFSGVSPAEDLAINTISCLTFGLIPAGTSLFLLAVWEVAVGILLISGFWLRTAVIVALVHMVCTFSPLFCLPELSFTAPPFSLTLIGQYIIKNLVLIAGLLIVFPGRIPGISGNATVADESVPFGMDKQRERVEAE